MERRDDDFREWLSRGEGAGDAPVSPDGGPRRTLEAVRANLTQRECRVTFGTGHSGV